MKIATIAILSLVLAKGAWADGPILIYDQGVVGFSYAQFPVGPYAGSFLSDGGVLDPGAFPPGGPGASMALRVEVAGVHYMVILGGRQNVDTTADVAFLFLRSLAPFAPGAYPVDPIGYTAVFGFVDDATSIDVPDDPHTTDWEAWVAGIIAEHKLLSGTGAIVLSTVTDTLVEGTFSGIAGEYGGGIMASFSSGQFSLDPEPLSVESSSWGSIKGLYR